MIIRIQDIRESVSIPLMYTTTTMTEMQNTVLVQQTVLLYFQKATISETVNIRC